MLANKADRLFIFFFLGLFGMAVWSLGMFSYQVLGVNFLRPLSESFLFVFSFTHLIYSIFLVFRLPPLFRQRHWRRLYGVPAILLVVFSLVYFTWSIPTALSPGTGKSIFNIIVVLFLTASLWHAAKQTFGITVGLAHTLNRALSVRSRGFFLFHLYSIIFFDFCSIHSQEGAEFQGFYVSFFNLPKSILWASGLAVMFSGIKFFLGFVRNLKGATFADTCALLLPVLTFYTWSLFFLQYPGFTSFIANGIHSLEYLFVGYLIHRQRPAKIHFWVQMVGSFVLGLLIIRLLPTYFETLVTEGITSEMKSGIIVTSVFLFFNFYHYAIDHLIWKKDSGTQYFQQMMKGLAHSHDVKS